MTTGDPLHVAVFCALLATFLGSPLRTSGVRIVAACAGALVRPSTLLDPADRLRIEAALLEARKGSSAEVAVVVVRASDPYRGAGWRLGLLLALVGSFGLASFVPEATLATLLGVQALGFVAGHALARLGAVRRRLVSQRLAEVSVERRARRAFAETGLLRDPQRAGLLLFLSLLERRVVLLADEGVEDRLPGGEPWQELIEPIVAAMRAGRAAEGLVQAVESAGGLLARHVPGVPGLRGALPVGLVLED